VNVIVRGSDSAALARARARVDAVTAELPLVDGFAATVDDARIGTLEGLGLHVSPDAVVSVPRDERDTGAGLDVSRGTLGIASLWEKGWRGQGVGIAVLDTGIAPHRDLRDRIVAFKDLVHDRARPYDEDGHGTHVAGIAAGDGAQSGGRNAGLAPAASVIGIKAFDEKGDTTVSRIIQGIQWAVDNREKYHIRVVNLSIGADATVSWKDDPIALAVERGWQSGLFMVTAAGNKGPKPSTVQSPGISPSSITVGNADTRGSVRRDDDRVFPTSGRGPTPVDALEKPDVCAPGTNVMSCDTNAGYVRMTGSSMAAPMVAGAAAVLLAARPDATPAQLKKALMDTAKPVRGETPATQGRGMIDPPAALAALPPPPGPG